MKVTMLNAQPQATLSRSRLEPQRGSPMNSRGLVRHEPTPGKQQNGVLPRRGRPMHEAVTFSALANPSGVHSCFAQFRGFRSFLAPPPAIHGRTAPRFDDGGPHGFIP